MQTSATMCYSCSETSMPMLRGTKDPFCLKQGEWGSGASQARLHRGGDTDLRWCNKACQKEGRVRIKVQGHESNDFFREFQVI